MHWRLLAVRDVSYVYTSLPVCIPRLLVILIKMGDQMAKLRVGLVDKFKFVESRLNGI